MTRALSRFVDQGQVQARLFDAGKMNIADCIQCNHCLFKQTRDRLCSIRDDMTVIFEAVIEADVLVLATPVYFGRLSGYLAKAGCEAHPQPKPS